MKLKSSSVSLINWYQKNISSRMRPSCVFYPSCSEYTKLAIIKYGFWRGLLMGISRILRCHPFQKNHIDPLK